VVDWCCMYKRKVGSLLIISFIVRLQENYGVHISICLGCIGYASVRELLVSWRGQLTS
jgi:hypothetical protein